MTNTTGGTRRSHGEGTIDQRDNGRFRVRVKLNKGTRKSITMDTREEAERALDAMLSEKESHSENPDSMTLAAWGAKWLNNRAESGNHRAIASERSTWKIHIATAPFIDWPLSRITRKDVKAWVATLAKKKALRPAAWKKGGATRTTRTLSRQSQIHSLGLLRKCLADAIEDEHLRGDNPAKDITVESKLTTEEAWSYLTQAEINAVVDSPKIPEPIRLLLTVAIYTGLRQGEMWGLHWSDVHMGSDRPEVVVRHSHAGPTKNGKIRRVPLLPPALEAFKRLHGLHPKRTAALVFSTPTGLRRGKSDEAGWRDRHITKTEVEPGWKTLAGITRRVRFHDLRHTCASHLLMGTWGRAWKLEEVCAFLGHSDITVTQRYAHLSPDHLHRAASETAGSPRRVLGQVPSGVPGVVKSVENHLFSRSERATGIEPATFSLGSSRQVPVESTGYGLQDPTRTQAAAKALLMALAQGEPVGHLADQLALAVLDHEVIRLALAVSAGGPEASRRATDLAALVLSLPRG